MQGGYAVRVTDESSPAKPAFERQSKNWVFLPEHEELTGRLFNHKFSQALLCAQRLQLSPDLMKDLKVLDALFGDSGIIWGMVEDLLAMAVDDVLLRLEARGRD